MSEQTSREHLVQLLGLAGPRRASAQDHIQMAFGISKNGDSTTSPGNLCECSVTLTVKMCFLMLRRNTLCFCLYLLPLVLSKDLGFFVQLSNFLPVLTLLGDNFHLKLLYNKCRIPTSGFHHNKTVFGRDQKILH